MPAAPVSSSAMVKSFLFCSFPSGSSFNTRGLHQLFLQSSFLSVMPPLLRRDPLLFNSQACDFGYIWLHEGQCESSGKPQFTQLVSITLQSCKPFITCPCQFSLPMCFQSNDESTKEFLAFNLSFPQTFHKKHY